MADLTCVIEGCDRPVKARGWCNRHYLRWLRRGSTHDRPRVYGISATAGYFAVHLWVNKHFPRIGRCELCAQRKPTEYAKATAHLSRWRHDWFELCKPCHRMFDGLTGPKTHCRRGHLRDATNTQVRADGSRYCRICANRRRRERRQKAVV